MLLRSLLLRRLSSTTDAAAAAAAAAAASATSTTPFSNIVLQNLSNPKLELVLSRSSHPLTPSTVQSTLSSLSSHRLPALRFFVWAGLGPSHRHSTVAFAAAGRSLRLASNPDDLLLLLDSYRAASVPVSLKTFKILVNLCLHSNLLATTLSLLHHMPVFGCRPDTPLFNTILRLLVQNIDEQDVSFALKVFDEMPLSGLRPDVITFVVLIRGLCKSRRVGDARAIVRRMRAEGCVPNKVVLTVLFDGACSVGDFCAAMEIIEEMESCDDVNCAPNAVTYTCLMKWLCENGRLDEALAVLDRMRNHGCQPNKVTIKTLLRGLCSQGRIDGACGLVERVVREGSISSEECHSLLVVCLLRMSNTKWAEVVLRMMLEKGVRPCNQACNLLVRELCSERRFSEGYCWFIELEEKGVASFDSDLYLKLLVGLSEVGHCTEALVVRRRIVERGIQVDSLGVDVVH